MFVHGEVVARVTGAGGGDRAVVLESLLGVLADRLEEPERHGLAGLGGDDQGLADELAEDVEHAERIDIAVGGDRLGRGEVEAAREHRETGEHGSFVVVELVVGPVDRGAQGLVAARAPAYRAGEKPEALVEALRDLRRSEHLGPRGRELDRERDAVQSSADLDDRADVVVVEHEVTLRGAGAIREELRRVTGMRHVGRGVRLRARARVPTATICSPATPRPSRLVASTLTPGQRSNRSSTSSATAPSTCSQLSSTSSTSRPAR